MPELEHLGCPWFRRFSAASFAADCVARCIGGELRFGSPRLRLFYAGRSGFTLPFAPQTILELSPSDDGRLVGALLNKVAHRGRPTRCSIEVERAALRAAAEAGVLTFNEDSDAGDYQFSLTPRLKNFTGLLRASLLPELMVDDDECELLLKRYAGLCTEPERILFGQLVSALPDKRLALCLLPQRQVDSLVSDADAVRSSAGRVDFAIEIPSFSVSEMLRVVVEVDDATHAGAKSQQDADFDALLRPPGGRFPIVVPA